MFQRKQVLPLVLIFILALAAQATTIAAYRVLREITATKRKLGVLDILDAWSVWLHI
jgi:hypothetical protein